MALDTASRLLATLALDWNQLRDFRAADKNSQAQRAQRQLVLDQFDGEFDETERELFLAARFDLLFDLLADDDRDTGPGPEERNPDG